MGTYIRVYVTVRKRRGGEGREECRERETGNISRRLSDGIRIGKSIIIKASAEPQGTGREREERKERGTREEEREREE